MANILTIPVLLAAFAGTPTEKDLQALRFSDPSPAPRLEVVAPPERNRRRELMVLSYNVRGLPWPIAKGRSRALRAIGRELAQMRRSGWAPDIVLIQEGFENLDELIRLSGYRFAATGPQRGDRPGERRMPEAAGFARTRYLAVGEGWGKMTGSGLHVLSDFPITEVKRDAFGYCAGWDCLANKGLMMVRIDVPGLPNGLEVVNTHLNARRAAKVPTARSLRAHHLQMEAVSRFIAASRSPGAPLLVGGDFNVKGAPDRYYYKAETRPYTVVSEFCRVSSNGCRSPVGAEHAQPWLASQDLQAFSQEGVVSVRPIEAQTVFDGAFGERLSDHDGYLVRYELRWR